VPTFSRTRRFAQDFKKLTAEQRQRFTSTVLDQFVVDLKAGQFRAGLRVKKMQATAGVWEMTWAPDRRATFEYGKEIRPDEPHVIWRRIGTHDIFQNP
jgi:mRNA-degrading endonuclease YafQ of YafQ-DinJ toxin-antitoxin module